MAQQPQEHHLAPADPQVAPVPTQSAVGADSHGVRATSPPVSRGVADARPEPGRNLYSLRSTTRATTSPQDSRPQPATSSASTAVRPVTSEARQPAADIVATLLAELEGDVAHDLVSDIVRGVLDDSRHTSKDLTAGFAMREARRRLRRLTCARTFEGTKSAEGVDRLA